MTYKNGGPGNDIPDAANTVTCCEGTAASNPRRACRRCRRHTRPVVPIGSSAYWDMCWRCAARAMLGAAA